ncbi:hypothetical protein CQW23_14470 [Capsicum baccatum]|uniref:Uncharacterized protein n=1 Tax=Capsicum baccatum TaxID=33114 RepID=A0A2G2WJC3_CAPBA|nr:hypothetical protein CQW23_14470 [Capsicum baccatum]
MANPVWDVSILRDVMRELKKEVHDLHWELAAVRLFTPPLGPVADRRPNLTPPPTGSFGDPDTNSGFKSDLIPSAAQGSQRFSISFSSSLWG